MFSVSNWMSKIRGKKSTNDDSMTLSRTKSDDSIMQETENDSVIKSGRVRYQRNVPGQPIIWEGEIVPELVNPKKKGGKTHFRHWPTLKQAIMNTPSGKRV